MSNTAAVVLVLLALTSAMAASAASMAAKCDSGDVSEAERSFKNCVESAQSGVMQRVSAADADAVDVCNSLDNMLAVCQQQKERLAECKGHAHAQKISILHLSVTADIVAQLNPRADVEKCAVFTQKKARPALDHRAEGADQHGGSAEAEAEAEGYGVGAASEARPISAVLGLSVLALVIARF